VRSFRTVRTGAPAALGISALVVGTIMVGSGTAYGSTGPTAAPAGHAGRAGSAGPAGGAGSAGPAGGAGSAGQRAHGVRTFGKGRLPGGLVRAERASRTRLYQAYQLAGSLNGRWTGRYELARYTSKAGALGALLARGPGTHGLLAVQVRMPEGDDRTRVYGVHNEGGTAVLTEPGTGRTLREGSADFAHLWRNVRPDVYFGLDPRTGPVPVRLGELPRSSGVMMLPESVLPRLSPLTEAVVVDRRYRGLRPDHMVIGLAEHEVAAAFGRAFTSTTTWALARSLRGSGPAGLLRVEREDGNGTPGTEYLNVIVYREQILYLDRTGQFANPLKLDRHPLWFLPTRPRMTITRPPLAPGDPVPIGDWVPVRSSREALRHFAHDRRTSAELAVGNWDPGWLATLVDRSAYGRTWTLDKQGPTATRFTMSRFDSTIGGYDNREYNRDVDFYPDWVGPQYTVFLRYR
jgi:hypothetical protein